MAGFSTQLWPRKLNPGKRRLAPGAVLAGRVGAGTEIHSRRGTIWATLTGDPSDLVPETGGRGACLRSGLLVIEGLTEAEVELRAPEAPRQSWGGLL